MESRRLSYRAVQQEDVDTLLGLVTDAHIKHYLFDGETMTRAWCENAVATSQRTFAECGLGLWLVHEMATGEPIGFCGYWAFEGLGTELQLLYALVDRYTGVGHATEAARALVAVARAVGMTEIASAVDEPNVASIRVLEKVGFERTGSVPGAFGQVVLFRLGL